MTMRRWLTIFLLVFMPLQFSWAVAGGYCTHHEEGKSAQHFGHHADGHEDLAADGHDSGQASSQNHAEQPHGYHHHGEILGIATSVPRLLYGESVANLSRADVSCLTNAPRARIERPKWSGLA